MGSGVVMMGVYPPDFPTGEQFPTFAPGEEYSVNGVIYRYAKFDNGTGNVAAAAGGAAYWKDKANGLVTSDKTDSQYGAAVPSGVAGIFIGVTTDGYFCWLARKGSYTVSLASGDSNGAVGNKIFAPASDVDLTLRSEADSSVSSSEIPATEIGRQLAAGSGNTALVMLNIP
jgi:hypothetical protein